MIVENPSTKGRRIANEVAGIIGARNEVDRVILFGNVAKEQASESSDVDLLITCNVHADLNKTEEGIIAELRANGYEVVGEEKPPMAIDIAVRHSWDVDSGGGNGVISRIRKHGIILYPKER